MGLEAVKNEIIEEARKKESFLIAEAKRESEKSMSDSKAKASKQEKKIKDQTVLTLKNLEKQDKATIDLEGNKSVMEAKKDITCSVIETVQNKIDSFDDSKKEMLIKKLLLRAKKDIKIGTIYCSKKDMKLLKDYEVRESKMIGGFIAETDDETVRVNYSFDSLLQSVIDKDVQEINNILFK
jgi:V/A-type H+/Na+-transporting ATPase subunit E